MSWMSDAETPQVVMRGPNGGTRPVPDPTLLTDAAIAKAVNALKAYIDGQVEVRDERLAGIDRATELRLREVDQFPLRTDEKVSHLKDLHDERFRSIATQFSERDTRSERESRDNKLAVDAAFAAQEKQAAAQNKANAEAIGKSEAGTAETINKLAELFESRTRALTDNLTDIKDRVSRIESSKVGGTEAKTAMYAGVSFIVALLVIGGIIAAAGGFGP